MQFVRTSSGQFYQSKSNFEVMLNSKEDQDRKTYILKRGTYSTNKCWL